MAQDMRIGIKKGGAYIAKWYNLATEDIKKLDGYIDGCYREGSVQVVFFS